MRWTRILAALCVAATLSVFPAGARADDAADRSWLIDWVERTISTPDRRITLGRIDGVLASDVRVASITIADRRGVWLTLEGAHLVWSRAQLLRGNLSIELLEAKSIVVTRPPDPPAEETAATDRKGFSLPQLPVAVDIGRLTVPRVVLAAEVAGQETELSLEATAKIDDELLHLDLEAVRRRPAGGSLTLKADYDGTGRRLALDLAFSEPRGGLVSSLMALPGEPAIDFSIKGNGPIDAYGADIVLAADGRTLLSGKATISGAEEGLAFAAKVAGSLEAMSAAPDGNDFLRGGSNLTIAAHQTRDGGVTLDTFDLTTGNLALRASARVLADGFPAALGIDGRLKAADGRVTGLPGTTATVEGATLTADFAEGAWKAALEITRPTTAKFAAAAMRLAARGRAEALEDPARRMLSFTLDGSVDRPTSKDAGLARALGVTPALKAAGVWRAGRAVSVDMAKLSAAAAEVSFIGDVDVAGATGAYGLQAKDLSTLSGVIGTDLAGAIDLDATGQVSPVTGDFSLMLKATSDNLDVAGTSLSAVMAGKSILRGRLARSGGEWRLEAIDLANARIHATADGTFGGTTSALRAEASLKDAAVLTDRAGGALTLSARIDGPSDRQRLTATVAAPALRLQNRRLDDGRATITGFLGRGPVFDGDVALSGRYDGAPVTGAAHVLRGADGRARVSGLRLSAADATLGGDIALSAAATLSGDLAAEVPNLARITPLLLTRAEGALRLTARLDDAEGRQSAEVRGTLRKVRIEGIAIGAADIAVTGHDLFGVPALEGSASLEALRAGGETIERARLTARLTPAGATALALDGRSADGPFSASGTLAGVDGGIDLGLDRLRGTLRGIGIALASPVVLRRHAGTTTIPATTLSISGGGSVVVSGTAGESLALDISAKRLPARLADAFQPDLGAGGTISAEATIAGPSADPRVGFDVRGEKLTTRETARAGVPPLQVTAKGSVTDGTATLAATIAGGDGLRLTTEGRVPLAGEGVDLSIRGTLPLALANAMLVERGARASGRVTIAATVAGSLARPRLGGTVSLSDGAIADPETATRLSAITGVVRLDGDHVTIERLTATTAERGSLALSGSVGVSGAQVADLTLTARGARISSPPLASAVFGGTVTVRGPLTTGPEIGGKIVVERAEITVPERFAANAATLWVKDLDPPPAVARSLARVKKARARGRSGGKAGAPFAARLDLTIEAPSRLFVRGRGLDVELGGDIHLTGPLTAVVPQGAFRMRRGWLDVVGRHIALDSGEVTLTGDLDPNLDFKATSSTKSIAVVAQVSGRASDPQLVLTSTPDLPQDEILAQFLFGHGIGDLSPLQMVQLGTAAAQLAGGPSAPDLLGSIRASTGLDTLGATTDSKGNSAVQAGRYIGERIYLGVTAGSAGTADATINLDVTKNIKLRAQTGTESSKGGIYFEKEY